MALEISLAQFNKIATGDYNAGQIDVRTNKDGQAELVKVNNHVWRKSQNTTVLSPERILEVKELFVNALRAGGVIGLFADSLIYSKTVHADGMSAEEFASLLVRFAGKTGEIAAALATQERDTPAPAANAPRPGDFLRV